MDVSRSVMNAEYDLQMEGLADAFRDDVVLDLIESAGGIMATVTQWSGAGDQAQTVPWRWLESRASTLSFADEITNQRRSYFRRLYRNRRHALAARGRDLSREPDRLSAEKSSMCPATAGAIAGSDPKTAFQPNWSRARLHHQRPGDTWRAEPRPLDFYAREVIGGPGAFVEAADGFERLRRSDPPQNPARTFAGLRYGESNDNKGRLT